jgi:hypothetical protein
MNRKLLVGVFGAASSVLSVLAFSPKVYAGTNVKPNNDIMFEWQISSVGSPYRTTSSWYFGTSGTDLSPTDPSTLTLSKSEGYSNTLTGTNNLSISTVSAAVGFSVTYSSSSTASYALALSPGQSGEIDWQDVYSSKNITEEQYSKWVIGGTWQPTGQYAYSSASEWIGFNYDAYNT